MVLRKKKSHRNKRKTQQWEKKKVYKRRQRRRYFSVYINKLKNLRRKKVCKFLWEGRIAQHWKKKFSIIHNIVAVLPANNTQNIQIPSLQLKKKKSMVLMMLENVNPKFISSAKKVSSCSVFYYVTELHSNVQLKKFLSLVFFLLLSKAAKVI